MPQKRPSAVGFLILPALGVVAVLIYWIVREPGEGSSRPVDLGAAQHHESGGVPVPQAPVEPPRRDAERTEPITPKKFGDSREVARTEGIAGLVQNEAAVPIDGAICELFENTSALRQHSQEGEFRDRVVTTAEGLFAFDRNTLSLAERYLLKVSHEAYATEFLPIDLKSPAAAYLRVTMLRGLSISGTVRTAGGSPLPNATILVYDPNRNAEDPNGSVETTATSDAQGAYTVAHVNPGLKKLTASVAGFATGVKPAVNLETGRPLKGIDFALADGGSISGRIFAHGTGAPVVDAWVTARASGVQTVTGVSPTEGRLEPRSGGEETDRAVPEVREKVYKEKLRELKERDEGQKPVTLKHYVTVAPQGTLLAVRSQADGTYVIKGAEIGRSYVVSVNVAGFVPPVQQTVTAPAQNVDFPLAPSARILGRVVDDETGKPVSMFTVGLTSTPHEVLVLPQARKAFGPPKFTDGTFDYLDVPAGRLWLLAEARGYAGGRSSELVIAAGERRDGVEIRLVRGATVSGRVLDSKGAPVANATVEAEPAPESSDGGSILFKVLRSSMRLELREARTGSDGSFTLPNLLAGSYALNIRHRDFGPHTTPAFSVPGSGEMACADITLARGCTIRGRVRLSDGSPDSKASVQVVPADAASRAAQRFGDTDAEGRFEISGLAAGSYRVVVAQRNGQKNLSELFRVLGQNQDGTSTIPAYALAEGEVKELDL